METSTPQAIKLALASTLHLSKDALHIYVGLAVFIGVAVLRKSLRAWLPLLAVLAAAVAGEMIDARDDIATFGYWRWKASLHDIVNTLFWPTVLWCCARIGLAGMGGRR
jgi:uncharacterized membrane protein YqgA involved in biofilm formation